MFRPVPTYLNAALALKSAPGSMALLLGAGISKPAGVPAAWQVLEILIGDTAVALGEPRPNDPETWWSKRHGSKATYDSVLSQITSSQEERRALLTPFFEATDEERNQGLKEPTQAHVAIARLVSLGLIRVILTTNFDLLQERALRQIGIEPVVVSSPDGVRGMAPLHSQKCVIVHLHGDYLTPGVLNTQDELGSYDASVDDLLHQVFDEYGIIAAGWSAEFDHALRNGLERSSNRRFATYWVDPVDPKEHAARLIAARSATYAQQTADEFFGKLTDGVESLLADTQLLSPEINAMVTSAKRQLSGSGAAISLHDQLLRELDRVAKSEVVTTNNFNESRSDEHSLRLSTLLSEMEPALSLIGTAAFWGNESTDGWWFDSISRFAHRRHVGGSSDLINLTRTPALLISYTAGVAAVASERHDLVTRLFVEPTCENQTASKRLPVLEEMTPKYLHVQHPSKFLYDYLHRVLVENVYIGAGRFQDAWERFQIIHEMFNGGGRMRWEPYVRVAGIGPTEDQAFANVLLQEELTRLEDDHPLIKHGLFEPSSLKASLATFNASFAQWAEDKDWSLIEPNSAGFLPSSRHYPGTYDEA